MRPVSSRTSTSRDSLRAKSACLTVVCSEKLAEFDDVSADKLRIYDRGWDRPPEFAAYAESRDGDVHIPQIPMTEPLQLQLQHFIDCVETGVEPLTNFDHAARVVQILDAAQQSLVREGAPIELGECVMSSVA